VLPPEIRTPMFGTRAEVACTCAWVCVVVSWSHMSQEQMLKDILDTVRFLRDHAVSKEDASDFVTKENLRQAKSEIMTHVDSFIVLHQKLDTELVALRGKYDRLEGQLQQIARHLNLRLQDA